MKATFVELPSFERYRAQYLDDDAFRGLQNVLMCSPTAGAVIRGTNGLRKIRFSFNDRRRGKGKRGGLRVIYYWWEHGAEFWLFTLYDKDEVADLTPVEAKMLGKRLKQELTCRESRHRRK